MRKHPLLHMLGGQIILCQLVISAPCFVVFSGLNLLDRTLTPG